ncbi:MAG: enoyl-CoA hydratase/isomerase family protein, partial [Proteobacteria bacterium]|nr:enoyl-CoA hydratase/isomerase family protein [Pseudomonadota bacterium]
VAWRVVGDELLMDEAHRVANRLSELPMLSVQAMKRVLNQVASSDLKLALHLETQATIAGFLDPETTRRLKLF